MMSTTMLDATTMVVIVVAMRSTPLIAMIVVANNDSFRLFSFVLRKKC